MDPTANLKEQLELAAAINAHDDEIGALEIEVEEGAITQQAADDRINEIKDELADDATRLAELVVNLNTWLSSGCFLPTQWRRMPDATGENTPYAGEK
jgi:chromosome segregation ATPase